MLEEDCIKSIKYACYYLELLVKRHHISIKALSSSDNLDFNESKSTSKESTSKC